MATSGSINPLPSLIRGICWAAAALMAWFVLKPMRKRHMREAREKRDRHKHNSKVTDKTRPFTSEEKDAERIRRSRTVDIGEFIENAEPARLENGDGNHIASIDDFL